MAGEISQALGIGRHHRGRRLRFVSPQTLIVDEEEKFVSDDSSSQRGAELVLMIGLLGRIEVIQCIEGLVAQEFVEHAMKLVGA